MDQNVLIVLLVGIAVTSSLFALGIVLYPRLKNEKQNYPHEAEIEAILLPLIYAGIKAADKLDKQCVDQLHQHIKGIDKKAFADKAYAMLPDNLGRFTLGEVKHAVTQERFEQLVQNAFDQSDRFFIEHQKYFDDLFDKWKAANVPADAQAQSVLAGSNGS